MMRNFKPYTSDAEIEAIGRGLIDRNLPKPDWTHAAHFAAALWVLACRPDIDAERDMPAIIRLYNAATGVSNTEHAGYHETITQASLRAARAVLAAHPGVALYHVANALMEAPLQSPDWLLAYWLPDTLFSPAARRGWVAPDRAELPF
jgi:hypothetical protein